MIGKLTVTPLLYLSGFLIVCNVVSLVTSYIKIKGLEADVSICETKQEALQEALDREVSKVALAVEANKAHEDVNARLTTLLSEQQASCQRVLEQGEKAVQQAKAARAESDRALAMWTSRYAAQIRETDCADALKKLDSMCPALRGY